MLTKEAMYFFTKEAKKRKKESKAKEEARKEGLRRYGLASTIPTVAAIPLTFPIIMKDKMSERGYTAEEAKALVPDLAEQYDGDYNLVKDINRYSEKFQEGKKPKKYVGPHYKKTLDGRVNNISVGRDVDEAVLAHELGHATGTSGPTKALLVGGNALRRVAGLSNAYNLGRIGLDHYDIVDDDVDRDDRLSNVQTGFAAQALGQGGTLAEEARATKRAIQSGLKRGKGLEYARKLAPGYATYIVPTIVAGTGYQGIKKYRETK